MKRVNRKFIKFWRLSILAFSITLFSCESFVDLGAPVKEISPDRVFAHDQSATAAVLGIYTDLWDFGYDIATFTGRSSDEFQNFSQNLSLQEFYLNQLTEANADIENLWENLYEPIYGANAVLEGLENSTKVSSQVKVQLEGEARFLRAFSYFLLTNLFGDIPLITGTDYRINAKISRSSTDDIYELILSDLITAQALLNDNYISGEKVRANKHAATSLLARVHLYLGNWEKAENEASSVINSNVYSLSSITETFLSKSSEAILQFYPVSSSVNTLEGYNFILTTAPPGTQALSSQIFDGFELDDLRKANWINKITSTSAATYYYPFKYKVRFNSIKTEYAIVLRLAEQYLIRAEARAQQNKLSDAVSDLDVVRERAALPLIQDTNPGISLGDLLLAIEQERKIELFTEWGHRWFDLKRTGRAEQILSPIKSDWQNTDQLYPIPLRERTTNPLLTQNLGY